LSGGWWNTNYINTMDKQSTGVVNQEKLMERFSKIQEVYSEKELSAYAFYLKNLDKAKEMRNTPSRYFNDRDYITDYIENENARNTYLKPKKNDSETRVNSGLLEKKIETIINELLTMNFQPTIRTFNKEDKELLELGDDMTDIVMRTNQQEEDDNFWKKFYFELFTQRAVFVREKFLELTLKDGKSKIKMAKKQLISGLKVFLGDISIPADEIDRQPYIATVDVMNFDTAKSEFGHLENWKHVQPDNRTRSEYLSGALSYRFSDVANGQVEIITYESLPDDEYQVIINGVMMYPVGTKLPDKFCNKYNLRMYSLKENAMDFAYGRPLAASAKNLQDLSDEMLRLLMRKFQQAVEPPLATSKKLYSRDIWNPGSTTQGLKAKDFEKMIDHNGVTDSEFKMYNLIEQKTEEFIGAGNVAQGLSSSGDKSATEILTMNKQFIKQLGVAIFSISYAKKDLTESRLYNVLQNYTKSQGRKFDPLSGKIQNVYRAFSLDKGKYENGMTGRKEINFVDRDLSQEERQGIYDEEEKMGKRGKSMRFKYINIKKLFTIPKFWYVIVESQDKEGTALDKVLFQDQLNQGVAIMQITGRKPNPDSLVTDFERKWKAKNWFQEQAPGQGQQEEKAQGDQEQVRSEAEDIMNKMKSMGGDTGAQVAGGLRRESTPKPSINKVGSEAR